MLGNITVNYNDEDVPSKAFITYDFPYVYSDINEDFITIVMVEIYPEKGEYHRKTYLSSAFPDWRIDEWRGEILRDLMRFLPEPFHCTRK